MSTAHRDLEARFHVDNEVLHKLQSFVEHETSLLDEGRFKEWLALFDEDASYWVPASREQDDPASSVSLFFDDRKTLETRVERLYHPQIHCQIPKSCTIRVVSNFKVLEDGEQSGDVVYRRITSKFIMLEDRPGSQRRLYGGRYTHKISENMTNGKMGIRCKRVDLTNCDSVFPSLSQPF